MTTARFWLTAWDWEPSVLVGCAALVTAYVWLARGHLSKRTLWFFAGVLLLLLDLTSPIDTLADIYLFSAHMLQHFLLALIIPALLVLGIPRRMAGSALRQSFVARAESRFAKPTLAWSLGVLPMIVWHIPVLFNAALANEGLHIMQHLSFLITGAIFWWPVLSPVRERRLFALTGVAYLFSACTACSILAAAITFAPTGLYPAYLNPDDKLGILPVIRGAWGLDPRSDQQLGGMLMWVPGCFVYLSAILATVARWYTTGEREAAA